jgi:DNA-binding beta-propeller fold protein YncE
MGDIGWELARPVSVYVAGNYAYVASQDNDRLVVINVTDPRNMFPTGFVTETLDAPSDVYVSGGYAYVTSRNNDRLSVFDLRNAGERGRWDPHLAGHTSEWLDGPDEVHVRGNHAYVLSALNSSLVSYNISDKANITATGRISTTLTRPRSLYVSGDFAYVAYEGDPGTAANCGLAVFDISDPENMEILQVIDMSDSQPEPEKPVGVFGSGNYIYVVNENHWSLSIYEVNHLQAPAATVGTVRAGYLEVNDNAVVNNDLVVDGGLNVGSAGALIGGELSVAGRNPSHIMGGLSIGEASKTISVTFGAENYDVLLPYPTHMLDVHGDARFRVQDTFNLAIGEARGFNNTAAISFFTAEQIEETSLTEVISPTAAIWFSGRFSYTNAGEIEFITKAESDPGAGIVAKFSEHGHLLPNSFNTGRSFDLGDPDHRWRWVYVVNGVNQLSDGRYKEDVADLEAGLDEIQQLRPVTFNWQDNPNGRQHYGLIAQEVAEVLPEVISVRDDPEGTLGMNYGELVPVLVNAIQEQQEQIEGQEAHIREMESRLSAFEDGGQGGLLANPGNLWLGGLALGAVALVIRRRVGGGL